MFVLPGDYYQGEVPVEKLNGVAAVFIPEYNNLNSPPAIVYIMKFGNEVIFFTVVLSISLS